MNRLVIISLALFTIGSIFAMRQDKPKLTHFMFTIESTSKRVSLACERGCAWKTMAFTLRGSQVFINQNGMVDGKSNKHEGNDGFLVGISTSDGKMELSCPTGCAWKSLSYAPQSAVRRIDELGVGAKMPIEQESLYVGRAYAETNDAAVCFDLPEGLVDWDEYAQRSLGEKAFKNPDTTALRKNFFEVGRVSVLRFEAAVPTSIARVDWFLLHENGSDKVRPAILRGEVMYDVDRNFSIIRRRPAFGKACIGAANKNIRAAFVIRGTGATTWSSHRTAVDAVGPAQFSLTLSGKRFAFTKPEIAVPRIKDVLLFKIGEEKSVILVVWDPDRNCEKVCCEFAYTLYEMGDEGRLRLLAENFYGCDI